jgi:hypothetical protein
MSRQSDVMNPNKHVVRRGIVDPTGSYAISYRPDRKIEIRLPGTDHIVIVGPILSRTNTGIVIVNPQGAVTEIPTFDPEKESVALTSKGLEVAFLTVPVIIKDGELTAWEQTEAEFEARTQKKPIERRRRATPK